MQRIILAIALTFLSPLSWSNKIESTIIFDKNIKNTPLRAGPIRWSPDINTEKKITTKSSKNSSFQSVLIKLEGQSKIGLYVIFRDGQRVSVPLLWRANDACFDTDGAIRPECFIDLALHDFDFDGVPEIVVSVGDSLIEQKVYILQYLAPSNPIHRQREESWAQFVLSGQSDCFISKEFISFRMGSRGFTETFFMKNGIFYKEH
jgi:hypothetical protein